MKSTCLAEVSFLGYRSTGSSLFRAKRLSPHYITLQHETVVIHNSFVIRLVKLKLLLVVDNQQATRLPTILQHPRSRLLLLCKVQRMERIGLPVGMETWCLYRPNSLLYKSIAADVGGKLGSNVSSYTTAPFLTPEVRKLNAE